LRGVSCGEVTAYDKAGIEKLVESLNKHSRVKHHHFELVDPDEDANKALQAWLNEAWDAEGGLEAVGHIEAHDRRGVHHYICQMSGIFRTTQRRSPEVTTSQQ
jgi:hypothetical protein